MNISLLLIFLQQVLIGFTQNGVIRPVLGLEPLYKANCQVAVQLNSATGAGSEAGGIVIPYRPQCRSDRPELFEARQCSQHDCFCVNVTTGAVFTGTRASPSEVGDCSTALYSVLLAIRTPVFNWSSPLARKSEGYRLDDEVVSSLTKAQDAELRDRIRFGLEGILKSVGGFQRVINVKQLVTVAQHSPRDPLAGGLIYYRAQVVSVGHSSVQDPQDLIRHRLHEGHIPSLGYVDPTVSRIDLLESDVEDPTSLIVTDTAVPDPSPPNPSSTQLQPVVAPVEPVPQDLQQSKSVIVRSSDPFAPAPVRSPSEKIERESRQLPSDDDSDPLLSGAVVAPPPQTDTGAWYHSWFAKSSPVNLLRQPGVIAGIVGSAVAILLLLILFILFCIYRLRKKDEGSYALDESKKLPNMNYHRTPTREFYA